MMSGTSSPGKKKENSEHPKLVDAVTFMHRTKRDRSKKLRSMVFDMVEKLKHHKGDASLKEFRKVLQECYGDDITEMNAAIKNFLRKKKFLNEKESRRRRKSKGRLKRSKASKGSSRKRKQTAKVSSGRRKKTAKSTRRKRKRMANRRSRQKKRTAKRSKKRKKTTKRKRRIKQRR